MDKVYTFLINIQVADYLRKKDSLCILPKEFIFPSKGQYVDLFPIFVNSDGEEEEEDDEFEGDKEQDDDQQ